MTKTNRSKTDLRAQAEAKLSERKKSPANETDTLRLIHELEVHQIELEMQNEELIRAQAEAQTLLNQYTELYDFAPVGYCTLMRDGTIQRVNLAGERLFGMQRSKLLKRRFGVFVSSKSLSAFSDFCDRVFLPDNEKETCQVELLNGEKKSIWVHLEAIFNKSDGTCLTSLSDITERRQAEDEIRQLNASLEKRVEERTRELRDAQEQIVRKEKLSVMGELAGSVGHELRNPLSVINSAAYYLKMIQPAASEETKYNLDIIEQEVLNAEKVINNLLDFGRTIVADSEVVSVSKLISQTLNRVTVPASIKVILDVPDNLAKVSVDPLQATQIFGNLILNACQAMNAPGGKLTISAALQGSMIEVHINDNGIGISQENMQKIFDPLFTTKVRGVGLGLPLSKKLIEANGGCIKVLSEEGKGTTFTVCLPLATPE